MTGVIIALGTIGAFLLSGYFLTKWEQAVFPKNQQNGDSDQNKK